MSKRAVVTGASSGIGYELTKLLAADGYDLIIVARHRDKLKKVQETLEKKYDIRVTVIVKDLSQPENAQALYDKLQKQSVDILINNAGFGDFGPFLETDWIKERAMIDLNITSLTLLSKRFAKKMAHQGSGKILNLASTAAFQAGPLMAVYFATKAYVLSFSEAIAEELAKTGVSVTALCPPPTATGFQSEAHMEQSGVVRQRSSLMSAKEVAVYGYEALKKGRRVAVPGWKNRLLIFVQRLLPRRLVVSLVRRMMKPSES